MDPGHHRQELTSLAGELMFPAKVIGFKMVTGVPTVGSASPGWLLRG